MKVITKGKGIKGFSIQVKCTGSGNPPYTGCGAVLEVVESDLFLTQAFEREGDGESFFTFECIECKQLNDLPKSKVPNRLYRTLPKGLSAWRAQQKK